MCICYGVLTNHFVFIKVVSYYHWSIVCYCWVQHTLAKLYIELLGLGKDSPNAQKLLNYRAPKNAKGVRTILFKPNLLIFVWLMGVEMYDLPWDVTTESWLVELHLVEKLWSRTYSELLWMGYLVIWFSSENNAFMWPKFSLCF